MERLGFIQKIRRPFEVTPAVALLGPGQCGKTTLARAYIKDCIDIAFDGATPTS